MKVFYNNSHLTFYYVGFIIFFQLNMFLKPREKLKQYGPKALEDDELLAIILAKGNRRENVFQLSKRLLKGFAREGLLNGQKIADVQEEFGIGFVQACQIIASFELGKRFYANEPPGQRIQSMEEAYNIVKNMQYLHKEYLRGLYINSRHKLIHDEIITIGSLDSNIIHPREVFRPAIEYGAYAVILAHNHPSGESNPSPTDIETTQKLQKIGELIQIPLLDHIVVGKEAYTSINKLLKQN